MFEKKPHGYRQAKAMMLFLCDKDMHNKECIAYLKKEMIEKNLPVEKFKIKLRSVLENWLKNFDENTEKNEDDDEGDQQGQETLF